MLRFLHADYHQLRYGAERAYPQESCGILLGDQAAGERTVRLLVPCSNIATEPSRRYQLDPREVFQALHAGRERGLSIIGFYHSHPGHPATYSATDLDEACWFGCSYVITAVDSARARDTKSFLLEGVEEKKLFREEEILIG